MRWQAVRTAASFVPPLALIAVVVLFGRVAGACYFVGAMLMAAAFRMADR